MKKLILFAGVLLLLITVIMEAEPYKTTVKVRLDKNFDFQGLQYFTLTLPDATAIVVTGDEDLPLIKQLANLDGKRVTLTLEEPQVESIK